MSQTIGRLAQLVPPRSRIGIRCYPARWNGRPGSGGLLGDRLSRARRPQKVFADFENAFRILVPWNRGSWSKSRALLRAGFVAALLPFGLRACAARQVRCGRRREISQYDFVVTPCRPTKWPRALGREPLFQGTSSTTSPTPFERGLHRRAEGGALSRP